MPTMTTATTTRCDCCGREAEQLNVDGPRAYCDPCHLYNLSAKEGAAEALVNTIGRMVEEAVFYEHVSPDDIRERIDEVLSVAAAEPRRLKLTDAINQHMASMPTGSAA